jgi:putative membrane protein
MSVVAMAAGVMLGGATLAFAQDAQDQSTQDRLQQQGQEAKQRVQQDGQRLQQTARDATQGDASQPQSPEQAKQVDQQIQEQLQQLSQQPEQAADKLFVLNTAIGNMYEMQLSQHAQQKAQSPEVKQLAQMIMQDHRQASQQLQKVAQQIGVQLPQGLPSMKMQEIQILSSLPAEQFEKQYVAQMNELHAKDVACFGAQMSLAQNEQVKQFVTQTLPRLQQHQQHVLQTASAMGLANPGEAVQAGSRQTGATGRSTPGGSSTGGSSGTGTSGTGTSGGGSSGGASSSGGTNR